MERIAFILGDQFYYWSSIVLTLAAGAAICLFLAFYLPEGKSEAAAVGVPVALVLSVFFARLVHWYFRPDSYAGFLAAITDLTSGGFALLGVFLGCGLTVLILKLLRLEPESGRMLDAMSLGGCFGICLGRLSCFFSAADRGQLVGFQGLPFAYPVNNVVTGAQEYRLATFLIQAMATAVIFAAVLAFFLLYKKRKAGDTALVFLLLYGMSQAVLDSTRYDSLFMRSNGFISAVQVSGAVAVVAVSTLFSVRMVKNHGFRVWYCPIWIAMLGMLGGAGYMEYYVQRHGDRAVFCYSVMTACLGGIVLLAMLTYFLSQRTNELEEEEEEEEEAKEVEETEDPD